MALFSTPTKATMVLGVRVGTHETFKRLVLDLQTRPHLKLSLANQSSQIRLFGPGLTCGKKLPSFNNKLIQSIGFQSFRTGIGEIKLNMSRPVRILKTFIISPSLQAPYFRYVIDLQDEITTPKPTIKKDIPSPKKISQTRVIPPQTRAIPPQTRAIPAQTRSTKKIIVIDPGHGGRDPGAKGLKGVVEKDITLQMAKILQGLLGRNPRYEVKLTRDRDTSVSLPQRVSFARRAKADLFLSLHADSHPRPDTRGLSLYTLSKVASDAEAEKLAAKENSADFLDALDLKIQSPEVANILIDLMKRETMNLSRQAANHLAAKLRRRVLLLRNNIRSANFAVLRTPELPAILVEMGYLSNKQDEKLLTTPQHQLKLCKGIVEGIDHYFGEHSAP